MFKDLCIDAQSRDKRAFLLSLAGHLLLLTGLIVVPLAFYEQLPDFRFVGILGAVPDRVLPTPDLPPGPIEPVVVAPQPEYFVADPWVAPTFLPDTIPPPDGEAPDVNARSYASGAGFPSPFATGVFPGGTGLGFLEGSLNPVLPPPPPPPVVEKEPVKVGGSVQAAKLIRRVEPIYPEIARRARIQGIVLLEVLIDAEGNVEKVELIRGQALLTAAAVEAVEQWKYSPTLLNGEPFPVIATVTVRFVLR